MDRTDLMEYLYMATFLCMFTFAICGLMPLFTAILNWVLDWLHHNAILPLYGLIYDWLIDLWGA